MLKNRAFQFLLSLFILFHLCAVLLFPNPSSILSRNLSFFFNDYGNLLGLNTTWQFFSPNPGAMKYIDYDVIVEKEDEFDIKNYQFPPQGSQRNLKPNHSRLFYFAVRMVSSGENISRFFIPYLCRKHPEATSIAIKTVEKRILPIERVKLAQDDLLDEEGDYRLPDQELSCSRDEDFKDLEVEENGSLESQLKENEFKAAGSGDSRYEKNKIGKIKPKGEDVNDE